MKIMYQGVDIYPDISVNQCYHEMYAEGHSDELILRLNDTQGRWDEWSPEAGDTISVSDGAADTGKMFIHSIIPENGSITLRALSCPLTALDPSSKSWEKVRFFQICEEIADRHALKFVSIGLTDHSYKFVSQTNEPDFIFLQKRCRLEGTAFLVFDGRLVVYDEQALEQQSPVKTIRVTTDSEFEFSDKSGQMYGAAMITNGLKNGQYKAGIGKKTLKEYLPLYMDDEIEASRYAAGLLRNANKYMVSGVIWYPAVASDVAAASMITVHNDVLTSWDGTMFVYRIRHDYEKRKTKIFLRKPLEGY